ncbi:MAG: MBL fold metallo-hydrolase [Actinomycetota bacterium]|nr:MBL fold metallo-hydrolase [Actinomycetota bacterium]MDQ3648070.1 MBL fold metallo-hydrolase [Actinomycetota bacterium]
MAPDEALGDPYAPAAEQGIHRIAVPTPFAVGRVNVYLIEDSPLTLVDAGPNSGSSFDVLQRGVEALGHRLEDIELVILTHQHIDHLGLVGLVASRSGAEVAAIDVAIPVVSRFREESEAEDEFGVQIMLRHGISEDVATALQAVSRSFRSWGAPVEVTRELSDGEVIELRDRRLQVLFRPGHSPTDTVFLDSERRTLLAADHLLKHISTNPLIPRPRAPGAPRPQALVTYLESLRKTREMELELLLPGHGEPITDHRALIDERFRMHARRAKKLFGLIAERPRTAHELAQELWGNIAVTRAYLTLSEVLGHIDLLLNKGRVREVERDGVVHFEVTGAARGG